MGRSILFLRLFVHRVRLAPTAILLEFDFAGHELFIFARPIVGAAALAASDFYELVL